jgi:hypothetical protein
MSDTPAPAPTTDATSFLDTVKNAIDQAHANGTIMNGARDVIAGRENTRRTQLLVSAFDKLVQLDKDYNAINKADNSVFTTTDPAEKPTETFTPKRRQEIQKAKKNRDDLVQAINNALTSANYDALEKAMKKGGDQKGAPAGTDSGD